MMQSQALFGEPMKGPSLSHCLLVSRIHPSLQDQTAEVPTVPSLVVGLEPELEDSGSSMEEGGVCSIVGNEQL